MERPGVRERQQSRNKATRQSSNWAIGRLGLCEPQQSGNWAIGRLCDGAIPGLPVERERLGAVLAVRDEQLPGNQAIRQTRNQAIRLSPCEMSSCHGRVT
eukprot:7391715-Prymnesium_polylepis.2